MSGAKKRIAGLTLTERAFIKAYFKTMSNTSAYMATHENCTRKTAGLRGFRMKEAIVARIGYTAFLEIGGISDAKLIKTHEELLNSEDEHVRIRAVKIGYQVKQRLIERHDVNISEGKECFTDALRRDVDNNHQNKDDDE